MSKGSSNEEQGVKEGRAGGQLGFVWDAEDRIGERASVFETPETPRPLPNQKAMSSRPISGLP